MSISDVNDQISTNVPLNIGESWSSKPVNVGEYNSIILNVKTDGSCTLYIGFSATGKIGTFDYSKTFHVSSNVNLSEVLLVSNLWCQIQLYDVTVNMSYIRFSSFSGKFPPNEVGNTRSENSRFLYDKYELYQIRTKNVVKIPGCSFSASIMEEVATTTLLINGGLMHNPYKLKVENSATDDDFIFGSTGGKLKLYPNKVLNGVSRIINTYVYPDIGNKRLTFSCALSIDTTLTNSLMICGFGITETSVTTSFDSGIFIYRGNGAKFGIVIANHGSMNYIPSNFFNIDTLEGSVYLPAINYNNLNSYQIELEAFGSILFKVYDNHQSRFKAFHYIATTNVSPIQVLPYNSSNFIMHVQTLVTGSNDSISVTNYEVECYEPLHPATNNTYSGLRTLTITESPLFVIKNYYKPNYTLSTQKSPSMIILKNIDVYNSGSTVATIKFYRNVTIGATSFLIFPNSNLQYSSPGGSLTHGDILHSFFVPPNESRNFILDFDIALEEEIVCRGNINNDVSVDFFWNLNFEEYY